jgi:hypothetical protein
MSQIHASTPEELIVKYADEISREAAVREPRSWARFRALLRQPSRIWSWPTLRVPMLSLRPSILFAPGLAAVVAAAALALVLTQAPAAVVAAGFGEATMTVGGRTSALRPGDRVPEGAEIRTAPGAWVAVRIGEDRLSVDEASRVVVSELSGFPRQVTIDQLDGRTWNVLKKDPSRGYVVRTSDGGHVAARGTAFVVETRVGRESRVLTAEGAVEVKFRGSTALVSASQQLTLRAELEAEHIDMERISSAALTAVVDALGRSCGGDAPDLPGCIEAGQNAVSLLAGVAKEVSLEIRGTGTGTLPLTIGGVTREIEVPAGGTFRIKLEIEMKDGQLSFELKTKVTAAEEPKDAAEAAAEAQDKVAEAQAKAERKQAKAAEAAARAVELRLVADELAAKAKATSSAADKRLAAKAEEDAREAEKKARDLENEAAEAVAEVARLTRPGVQTGDDEDDSEDDDDADAEDADAEDDSDDDSDDDSEDDSD